MKTIMTRAWEIYHETGCTTRYEFGLCLQMSWSESRMPSVETIVSDMIKIANEKAYSDYRVNAGIDRKAIAKVWEKNGISRTYINIRCFTANGKYKGSYDCGYVDNATAEYIVTDRTEINLAA